MQAEAEAKAKEAQIYGRKINKFPERNPGWVYTVTVYFNNKKIDI